MVRQKPTWVFVACDAQAKIYKLVQFPKIEEIHSFEHPESRLKDQDLVSSPPGRTFASVGTRRSAYETKTDPKSREIEKFAKELSQKLIQAFNAGEFGRLYLIASPEMMGLIRPQLNGHLKEAIVAEIAKDYHTKDEVEKHLASL